MRTALIRRGGWIDTNHNHHVLNKIMYSIIEDCSPYYITFTFTGIEELIDYANACVPWKNETNDNSYSRTTYDTETANSILKKLPFYHQFDWWEGETRKRWPVPFVFTTPKGSCSSIHKDGIANETSFNLPLSILDDKCKTSWYADEEFVDQPLSYMPYTRQVYYDENGYDSIPKLKQMTAKPNQMILFNTNIFHSWENNQSANERKILIVRGNSLDSSKDRIYFNDARKILFGF